MNRQSLLMLLLALTLIAVYFAPPRDKGHLVDVRPIQRNEQQLRSDIETTDMQAAEPNLLSFNGKREWPVKKTEDLFAAKLKPVVLPPPVIASPPKPTAPPLPFVYLGKVIDDGKLTVFVSRQQQNFVLKGGEVLEGTYRVDKVEPGKVVFTYLPLNTEQMMTFGGSD